MNRERLKEAISEDDKTFIIDNFEKLSEKIIPENKYNEVKDDPKDNKFLECAVSAQASYIISGDEHLLKLKEFQSIKIVSPAEFMKKLNIELVK